MGRITNNTAQQKEPMSFGDLKKNKSSVFQKLQKQLDENTNKGNQDDRFWKPTVDKAGNGFAVIRFLPASDGEDLPYVKLYSHAFQGVGGWYIENSLTTLGKDDPLGEYNRELWNSGDESLKEQVRKQKRKLSYYSNIYVVKDPGNPENEGRIFLFRYGKKIHDKIMDAVNGDELEGRDGINPFCFWQGADFKLRVKKVAGYPNYDSSEFVEPGTLEGHDDPQLESIWKRQFALQELVAADKFKSYDQLKGRLDKVIGRTTRKEEVPETPAPSARESISAPPSFKKEDPVPEVKEEVKVEEEDDVMDYFKRLAEE